MRRLIFGLTAVAAVWAAGSGSAWADPTVTYAPPGAWVKPVALPTGDPKTKPSLFRALLANTQGRFTADGDEIFIERASQITSEEALSLGSLGLVWDPATESLVINRVNLIRDGKVIDVLASGQTFTVLRREPNLEASMLDGRLTAALQIEGLQVGDTIDAAYTTIHHDPTFRGRSEDELYTPRNVPIERVYVRAVWPDSIPMKWRETSGLKTPVIKHTSAGTELTIEMTNATLRPSLEDAERSARSGQLQLSDFADWQAVSKTFAPLFDKAAALAPDSAVKAEAAKIAALSPDPRLRADAALKLVQDKVRYVFLGMDLGGYVPADAELTWKRRFGDCKGKTALLLALLREMGIQAEPALVSATAGRGVADRLPGVHGFDHVLVRATIGGRAYWLDGTRRGDDNIDLVALPAFTSALPVLNAGAGLEPLVEPQPGKPLREYRYVMDATAGLDSPAQVHFERTFRGTEAMDEARRMIRLNGADADTALRGAWKRLFPGVLDASKTSYVFDRATGEVRESLDGSLFLNWTRNPATGARTYVLDHRSSAPPLNVRAVAAPPVITDVSRPRPVSQNLAPPPPPYVAPPAVAPRVYVAPPVIAPPPPILISSTSHAGPWEFDTLSETILLPQGGVGFHTDGADVNQTMGGREMQRTTLVKDGVLTLSYRSRTTQLTFSSEDRRLSADALNTLRNVSVSVSAPAGYAPSAAETAIRLARKPQTPSDYRDHAEALFDKAGDYDGAIKDLTAALAASPDESNTWNYRCYTRAEANRDLHAALGDCDEAIRLNRRSSYLDSRALVYFRLGQFDLALKDYNAALELAPAQAPSLYMRGVLLRRMGLKTDGDADIKAALKIDPAAAEPYVRYGVVAAEPKPPEPKPAEPKPVAPPPPLVLPLPPARAVKPASPADKPPVINTPTASPTAHAKSTGYS